MERRSAGFADDRQRRRPERRAGAAPAGPPSRGRLQRLVPDLDRERDFSQGGVIGAFLNYVATIGFEDTFSRLEFKYRSARAFRERYLIELLKESES